MAEPNYFTCTLGQAAALKTQQQPTVIPRFLEEQSRLRANDVAVGFARPGGSCTDDWTYTKWTFSTLQQDITNTCWHLQNDTRWNGHLASCNTVALLCPSNEEFLVTWLAFISLGKAVLLIAPQCTSAAIANLCISCNATMLLVDDTYSTQAKESVRLAKEDDATLRDFPLPYDGKASYRHAATTGTDTPKLSGQWQADENDVAYLHHTSGTSSGMPKPIPQTHKGAVGVLPSFPLGSRCATFTTTPLYHGGPADIFRAWTSGAMIWLFPGKAAPITASNIVKCLDVARKATEIDDLPPVRYFSSVPYVLQMMESDPRGMQYLREMDIVGVGGAALPTDVGDLLVSRGVRLISRYGSAECGFLLSSHREYEKDNAWQFLRSTSGADYLTFEKQPDDNLRELIVLPGWPHMAKQNREDGSFATSDLFEPHPAIPNAWKYHSRADSQLTLVTGKKFDPAPLEDTIATSDLLDSVLIFGDGQPFAAALLFRSQEAKDMGDADLVERLWPLIDKLNSESQDHARLAKQMLKPMPVLERPLEQSSKGTLLRGAVLKRFAVEIEAAYSVVDGNTAASIPDADLQTVITGVVQSAVTGKRGLTEETNLFSYGVDSIAGMQIRHRLRQLLPERSSELPINVVEDCGNIRELVQYVKKLRRGEVVAEKLNEHEYMLELVKQYGKFEDQGRADAVANDLACGGHTNGVQASIESDTVVLTGVTGALGAHVLDMYRSSPGVSSIYCLVRGADAHACRERVNEALSQRQLHTLNSGRGQSKVVVLRAQLSERSLGLAPDVYDRLAREATVIMHLAWSVNFRLRLRSFAKDSIAGVTNLINLALASPRNAPPIFAYCSSVASVLASTADPVPESIDNDPAAATDLGYSQSKWAAEQICQCAHRDTRLRDRVVVYRVGQLAGDRQHGIWNAREAWPMMLSASKLTKTLPVLEGEVLNWLPVDVAASALLEGTKVDGERGSVNVLHVLNEHQRPRWSDLLAWMKGWEGTEATSPDRWLAQLENVAIQTPSHPALQLLDHWRKAYGGDASGSNGGEERAAAGKDAATTKPKTFAMQATREAVPSLRDVDPVDEAYFAKVWTWIKTNM